MRHPRWRADQPFGRRRGRLATATLAVTALTAALAVGACGGSGDSSGAGASTAGGGGSTGTGGKKLENVAVNMYARDNPFFAEVVNGIEYEAKRKGVDVDVQWAQNDPVQEVNQIQNAITRHPDGLVVSPIDAQAIVPPIAQAHDAGIPVVTVTDNIAPDGQDDQLAYLGTDYEQTGEMKAKYMARAMHGNGEIGVVHLIRGLDFTESQWKGAQQVFAKYPGIKIVNEIYAGGAASNLGLKAAENILTAHPNLAGIYVDNDPLALGVIQAVQARHIDPSDFVIVAGDGTPDAMKAIKDGTLDMTVNFCGYAQGMLAIDSLDAYVTKGVKPTEHGPQIAVTKKNVDEFATPKPGCDAP